MTTPANPQSTYLAQLRQRLMLLDDVELDAFCLDYFPLVYERFGRGMRKDEKITLLLDHVRREEGGLENLERALAGRKPSPAHLPSRSGWLRGRWLAALALLALVILFAGWRLLTPLFSPGAAATLTSELPTSASAAPATRAPTVEPVPASPTLPSPSATPPACAAYQEATDNETLKRLIAAEAAAVNSKDLQIIAAIFAPEALIWDAAAPPQAQLLQHAHDRYAEMFQALPDIQVTHTDVISVGLRISASWAWYDSGNTTRIGSQEYTNPPGSDHWAFVKAQNGCWVIDSLVFNAAHINFPCYCQAPSDDETLRCLINAEAQAVGKGDILALWRIFAVDARIERGASLLSSSPLAYYQALLQSNVYQNPQHMQIEAVKIEAGQAWYTSGSSGAFGPPNATPAAYNEANPSNHWTFARDAAGCWVINQFAFEASSIPFPP